MPAWASYLLTAVVSGAVTGFASCISQPGPTNWQHCGIMAGVGAIIGVVNHFRTPPGSQS